jgi:DNA (cytosine-5)-methyltransferase 1
VRYLSVCSGVEAATVAWHPLGWEPVAFSEIEKFPSEVLKHHYPDVPNLGDMTKYKEWDFGTSGLDLLVGGTPCQSFSVAGLRKGIEDPRGNLALVYCGILDKFRPKWFVWENVPGVLSSGKGRDFGSLLGAMAELGYSCAYRVLDAQYFGVPQRRKRVFIVGHLGDWRNPAKVLFESESLSRNNKESKKQRKDIAATITARFGASRNNHEELAPVWPQDKASTLNASFGSKLGLENQHINSGAPLFVPAYVADKAATLLASGAGTSRPGNDSTADSQYIAHAFKVRGGSGQGGKGYLGSDETAFTLATMQDQYLGIGSMAVRRLTPKECERLQGFPDDYTNIKDKCPDGPRYKAMGNSMAVPVMQWIGKRIQMVEDGLL